MNVQKNIEDVTESGFSDFNANEYEYRDSDDLTHKRHLRKLLEDKMDMKRLMESCKDEWDDTEDEFDWEKIKE